MGLFSVFWLRVLGARSVDTIPLGQCLMSKAGSEPDLPLHANPLQEALVVAHHDQGSVKGG